MGPRRPPPLPKTLFEANGPLAPGSAPLPPSPTRIHPAFVIDAHSFVDGSTSKSGGMYGSLPENMPRPNIKTSVRVVLDPATEPSSTTSTSSLSIHPTILDLSLPAAPHMANTSKSTTDLIVPCTVPLTSNEWDLLDEAVAALDNSAGVGAMAAEMDRVALSEEEKEGRESAGKIIISGFLPPPLTTDSDTLGKDPAYDLYIGRLNQLSLHSSVYLKVLPPVFQASERNKWASDRKELERVLRMYLSPAIESFGTHRMMFGSSTAIPAVKLTETSGVEVQEPIKEEEWYAVLRKAITEFGEGEEAVNGIFGGIAAQVYGLE